MQWVGVYFYTPRMGYCRSMSNHLSKVVTHDQSHNVLGTKKGKTEKLSWGVHFFKKEHHPKNTKLLVLVPDMA